MDLRRGSQIDRYVLENCLGEGGQGSVWSAEDQFQTGRKVALKLVPMGVDTSHWERVRREARHLAQLKNPGLPACYGLFEDLEHGLLVVVMELVQGPTLADATSMLDEAKKVAVLRQLAATLAFLHTARVVHRDIKPENVILCHEFWGNPLQHGTLKLIDLGISVNSGNPQPLTVVGHIIGTPSFLAPEILDPHYFPALQDTPTIDIFALGVLGWGLFFGCHPTGLAVGSSMTSFAMAYREADGTPGWPASPRPFEWETLLRRCLAVRARERFPSAIELLNSFSSTNAGLTSSSFAPPPSVPLSRLESSSKNLNTGIPDTAPDRSSQLPPTRIEPVPASPSSVHSSRSPHPFTELSVAPPAASLATPPPIRTSSTVFAAPIPASFEEVPARAPSSVSAPPKQAPIQPVHAPAHLQQQSPAHLQQQSPAHLQQQIEKPKTPTLAQIFRYILATILLLIGGGLTFILTIILFLLYSLGR